MDEIKWKTKAGFGKWLLTMGSWFWGALCACIVVGLVLLPFTKGVMSDMLFVAKLVGLMLGCAWLALIIVTLVRYLRHRHTTIDYKVTEDEIRVAVRARKIKVRGVPVYALKHIWTRPYGLKVTTHNHSALLFCDRQTAHQVRKLLKGEM